MATSIKRSKGSQSSLRIGTFSYWIKIATPHSTSGGFQVYTNTVANDNNRGYWQYTSDGKWRMVDNDDGGTHIQLRTNRLFRDHNAWYHFVVRIDTTQATSTDRVRLYVNGVQETSFDQTDYPTQNTDLKIFEGGQTDREYMNRIYGGSPQSANWYVSHFHYCDGQSYGPDSFGSTDATTGEWKINTSPSVTYGNQGWFMFKNDASLNDDSGNSNNWSSDSGTIQKSEDNPSNVFATLNPLIPMRGTPTYQSGNTYFRSDYSNWDSALSTIGATSGKWYFEAKWGGQDNLMIGCVDVDKDPEFLSAQGTYGYVGYRGISYFGETSNPRVIGNNNNDLVTGLTTFASGDIIGCAIDLDNREMFVHRNGTYTNSGNPATRANPYDMSTSINQGGTVLMGVASRSGYGIEVNFGNGYFSSTAISSAGTNASNLGIFEYDVPSGYTALCTKGLNE